MDDSVLDDGGWIQPTITYLPGRTPNLFYFGKELWEPGAGLARDTCMYNTYLAEAPLLLL